MADTASSAADSGYDSTRGETVKARIAAIAAMSDKVESPVPGMEVMKTAKPYSRTVIGRFSQRVKELPVLYVAELKMNTESVEGPKVTKNREYRLKAAEKWIEAHMSGHRKQITVDVGRRPGIVRLIFCVKDEAEKQTWKSKFNIAKSGTVEIGSQKRTRKIRCTIKGFEEPEAEVYASRLNAVVRQIGRLLGAQLPIPVSMDINYGFDPLLPGCNRGPFAPQPMDYRFHIRYQASVDVSSKQINVDADVVPCMPSKPLAEVVYDMIGQTGVEEPEEDLIRKWLPKIKHSLLGVTVRCSYIPRTIAEGADMLAQNEMSEGRRFQIRDIQMPDDPGPPLITFNQKPVSIYDYFKNCKSTPLSITFHALTKLY